MKEDKVVVLDCITRLDLPVERVLDQVLEYEPESIVVLGYDKDGEFFFASSKADGGHANWLLDIAKKRLLEIGDV